MTSIVALVIALLVAPAVAQDISVIDGDTLEINGEVIDLWGIDAPELEQACAAFGEPVGAGLLAMEVLQDLSASIARCEPVNGGPHGHTVARCFLTNGDDLGGQMVAAGFAWNQPEDGDGAYADEAAYAQANGRGLTTIDCMPPWEWRAR